MSQICPHCGSKYTTDKGISSNIQRPSRNYYCESCHRYFEVATGEKGATGEWLMTFRRGYDFNPGSTNLEYFSDDFIAVYRAPNGKTQINQHYTHYGRVTYSSREITPRIYIQNGCLRISTFQAGFDSNGAEIGFEKIEMNPEIEKLAKSNDAMRGMFQYGTCSNKHSTHEALLEDRRKFLQSILGTPTNKPSAAAAGPCYVATAVYGSYDCPQVWTLRRFRDNTLASTWYGRVFIRTYYAVSPTLVKWFGHTKWFKKLWKGRLDKMIAKLNASGVADTPYEDRPW